MWEEDEDEDEEAVEEGLEEASEPWKELPEPPEPATQFLLKGEDEEDAEGLDSAEYDDISKELFFLFFPRLMLLLLLVEVALVLVE